MELEIEINNNANMILWWNIDSAKEANYFHIIQIIFQMIRSLCLLILWKEIVVQQTTRWELLRFLGKCTLLLTYIPKNIKKKINWMLLFGRWLLNKYHARSFEKLLKILRTHSSKKRYAVYLYQVFGQGHRKSSPGRKWLSWTVSLMVLWN